MKKIVQKGDPVLRNVAKEVPVGEITSEKIRKIIEEMNEALAQEKDGVGLAAPQIGYSLRIFILAPNLFEKNKERQTPDPDIKGIKPFVSSSLGRSEQSELSTRSSFNRMTYGSLAEIKKESGKEKNLVFINPEIIKLSKEKKKVDEGCLSVRPLFGKIERRVRAKVRAYDPSGQIFERGGSGLLAQIFQHEIDHLNGILFIDKATDIKEIPPNDEK